MTPGEIAREAAIAHFAARRAGRPVPVPESAEVRAALAELEAVWNSFDGLVDDPALRQIRTEALARLEASPARKTGWRATRVAASLLLIAGSAAALAGMHVWRQTNPAPTTAPLALRTYDNGQAPPRKVVLADGTRLTLDAQTRLQVGENATRRQVLIERGRVFFEVRHDAGRPFRVSAGNATVTDIGTTFEVSAAPGVTRVTLVEGAVSVTAPGRAARQLSPGLQLTLAGGEITLTRLDARRSTDWQSGMISADSEPLASLVTRFNIHLARPLALRDATAGNLPVSGVFRLDDPQGFIAALAGMGHPDAVVQAPAPTPTNRHLSSP